MESFREISVLEFGVSQGCHFYWIGGSTNVSSPDPARISRADQRIMNNEYIPDDSGISPYIVLKVLEFVNSFLSFVFGLCFKQQTVPHRFATDNIPTTQQSVLICDYFCSEGVSRVFLQLGCQPPSPSPPIEVVENPAVLNRTRIICKKETGNIRQEYNQNKLNS